MFILNIILGFIVVWILFFVWGAFVGINKKIGKWIAIIFVFLVIVMAITVIGSNPANIGGGDDLTGWAGPIGGFIGGLTYKTPRKAGEKMSLWAKDRK